MVFATVTKALRVVMVLLAISWMAPASISARSATIQNIPPTPHYAPPGTPLADLAEAVKRGVASSTWQIVGEAPGSATAVLRIRSHMAKVVIRYDESDYQIDYSDSLNLNFRPNGLRRTGPRSRVIEGPSIHPNYNVWVRELASGIETNLRTPPKSADPPAAEANAASMPSMIADELDKLDALRQRGVLTQQEFDEQKAKLLK